MAVIEMKAERRPIDTYRSMGRRSVYELMVGLEFIV